MRKIRKTSSPPSSGRTLWTHGDKAPGKALSYAKKAFVLKLLELESISEGEERQDQFKSKQSKITPNAGAGDDLTEKQKSMVRDTHTLIVDALNEDRDADALGYCESITDDMLAQMQRYFFLKMLPPSLLQYGYDTDATICLGFEERYFPLVLKEIQDKQQAIATKREERAEKRIKELQAQKKAKQKPQAKKAK